MLRTPKSSGLKSQVEVGSRVRVNKDDTKVGIIAFIGQTSFAPGEWIGINLDSPHGKNDGSVQGTQYFQAKPNHGLFARIANVELLQVSTSQIPATATISATPSLATPKTSSASISGGPATNFKLKLGDRVRTTGGRMGVLRYCGPTEFASGFWAGIELDSPQGKNDGAVKGKRYFNCKPNYGVFATLENVQSVSDPQSNLRRSSNATTTSKSQMKKPASQGPESTKQSMESLLHQIKEKDRHIEQLLQERDLERSEVAHVAAHNEEVEKELDRMRLLCSTLKSQCDEYQSKIGYLAKEKEQLVVKITEKSSAIEDMEFRLAEEEMEKTIGVKASEAPESCEPTQDLLSQCKNLNDHLPAILRRFSILRNETQRSIQELHSNQSPELAKSLLDTCLAKQNNLYEELKVLGEAEGAELSKEEHVPRESSSDVELQRLLAQLQTQEAELVDACMHLKEAEAKAAQASDLEVHIKFLEMELEQAKVELSAAACRETEMEEKKESAAISDLRCALSNLEEKLATSNHKLQELTLQLQEAQKESKDFVTEVIAMLQSEATVDEVSPDSLLELRNWISLKTSQLALQNEKAKMALAEAEALQSQWEKQISALKKDLEQAQSDSAVNLEKEKSVAAELQKSIEKLQKEKENLSLELDHSRKMHDENTGSVLASMEEEKSIIMKAKDSLEEELKIMKTNNENSSSELQKVKQLKLELEEELKALKLNQNETIASLKSDLEAKIALLIEEKTVFTNEIERLNNELSQREEKQKLTQAEFTERIRLLTEERDKLKTDLEPLQNSFKDNNNEINAFKTELEDLKSSKIKVENQHNEARANWDIEKKLLLEQIEHLKKVNLENEALFVNEKERIGQELEQLKKAAVDDSTWRAAIAEKDRDIIALKEQLQSTAQENKTNSATLQSERKKNSELHMDIEKLSKELAAIKRNGNGNTDTAQDVQVTSSNGDMNQSQNVAVLNEIIASLHSKLESLQTKYDRLTSFDDDMDLKDEREKSKTVRKVRVYCDVCEVFDAHETEDCPVGELEEPEGHYIPSSKSNRLQTVVVRPYCEHCGVFDQHDSAECPEPSSF